MNPALLDTDILSFFLKGDETVVSKTQDYLVLHDQLTFTQITYFEILAGLEYRQANKQLEKFNEFASKSDVLTLTNNSIKISADVYGKLRRQGMTIGTPDILIAGVALANNLELVTNNEKHYKVIDQLKITNWKL